MRLDMHLNPYQWFWTALMLVTVFVSNAGGQTPPKDAVQLDKMMVTAKKSKEDKQQVPANVTALDGFTMQDMGIGKIDELTNLSPNIHTCRIDAHTTQVVFRGIGGLTNMNKVWNTNVDGVAVPYVGVDMFLDVERVELMRGSQGSLYGRNTHAGVVNVITRKPTSQFSLDTSINTENDDMQKVKAAFGGPVGNNHGYRLALGHTRADGYMQNDFLGTDDGGRHEQFSGRLTYECFLSKGNVLRFTLTGDTYNGGFDVFSPVARGTTTTTVNNEAGENKGYLLSPTMTWEKAFSGFTLTSITNYSKSNYAFVLDQDFTQADLMKLDYEENFRTFTQEFRLTGDFSGLEWLGGVFLMAESVDYLTDFSLGGDAAAMGMPAGAHSIADSSIDSSSGALFGQVTMKPFRNLAVRAGLRLDYEKRNFKWQGHSRMDGAQIGPRQDFTRNDNWFGVMPSASLSYFLSQRQQIYGSVSRGYKTGDYAANQVSLDAVRDPVDPEYTMTCEIGYKGLSADKRLELNAALFYIEWTDMQVSVMNNNIALMQNAAEAHSYGAELEARWRAAKGLDLLAGLGWLEGEFDSFENHPSGRDLTGNQLPNANTYSLSLAVRYRRDNGFFTSLSATLLGPKYLDEQNLIEQKRYTLVNARVGYESPSWAVYAYGRNLLDENHLIHSFDTAVRAGEPAIVGVQADYFF